METSIHLSESNKAVSKPGFIHWVNLLYLLIAALSVLMVIVPPGAAAGKLPKWIDPAFASIIAQIGLILIPAMLFLWLTRQSVRDTLKLHPLGLGTGVKCFLIGLLCWPLFSTLTNLSQLGLALAGAAGTGGTSADANTGGSPWLLLIGIVILAPLFEEILFRGVMLSAYENRFGARAIWLVGILFAVFHFDLERLMGALFVGLVAGWLVYRTRSIWSGVLMHMGVNLIGGLMLLLMTFSVPGGAEGAARNAMPQMVDQLSIIWTGIMVWGGIGLVLLVPVFFLLKRIGQHNPVPNQTWDRRNLGRLWSYAIVIIAVCVYYITQFL